MWPGPAVADPACLEVDIVFKRAENISDAHALILQASYSIPSLHMPVSYIILAIGYSTSNQNDAISEPI